VLEINDIVNMIKKHEKSEEIIKIITSDFEYYNSLLLDGELTVNCKKIKTRTTFLGLAALYGNTELLYGLLKAGVPADGLDLFLYRRSLYEPGNYRLLSPQKTKYLVINQSTICWSTLTEVVNSYDEPIESIPWSTPVILAILSENADCLKLLLEFNANCDLRHFIFADALSLCEDEAVMNVLLQFPAVHIMDTTADVLTVFNLKLAKFLYDLGIRPDNTIINKIKDRYKILNTGFFDDYNINASSKLWDDYYRIRAEECIKFYESKGFIEIKEEEW